MGVDMLAKMALFKNYQKTATYYTWLERYLLIQSHCIILSSVYYAFIVIPRYPFYEVS